MHLSQATYVPCQQKGLDFFNRKHISAFSSFDVYFHRYKQELSSAVEREAALERGKAQLDLDWQRRYEGVERLQYEKAEDLTKNLISARDKVGGCHISFQCNCVHINRMTV